MKRILIFSLTYYPTRIGGAEIAIKEITDRIPDIEFDMVTLHIDRRLPKVEKLGNVTLHRVGAAKDVRELSGLVPLSIRLAKVLFPITAYKEAVRLHKEKPYDAIWGMMAAHAGLAAVRFKMRHPRVPFLLTLQEGIPISEILKKASLVRPWFNRIFTEADRIQAISRYLADWGKSMGYRGEVEVVPNAVDTKRFSVSISEEERAALRSTLGAKDGETLLITTSRLVHKNGIDTVIRALPELPNAHFAILGTGPDELKLRTLARSLQVESKVTFLGQVEHGLLPKYLAASDIFIRPSRSEGMGNSFIEAMATGIPVIATQEGGIRDFLFDAKRNPERSATGWAVDIESSDQIAETVKEIMAHPEKREQTIRNAQTLVRSEYDWEKIAGRMHELLRELVAIRY